MLDIATIRKSGKTIFGIELTGIRIRAKKEIPDDSAFASAILNQHMDFAHSLHSLSIQYAIEIRYLYNPKNPYLITIYFLVQLSASTKENLDADIESLATTLLNLLHVNFRMHEFTVVKDKAKLKALVNPFAFNHITEIARREDMIPLDSIRKISARTMGFARGASKPGGRDTRTTQAELYHIFPYLLSSDNMERLCNTLFLQQCPCLFSVCMMPYPLLEQDEAEMERRIVLCEKFSQMKISPSPSINTDSLSPFLNRQAEKLYEHCTFMLTGLQDAAFLQKIQIASELPLNEDLVHVAGVSITEHTGHPNLSFKNNHSENFAGGYEWYQPKTKKEFKTAVSNLENMAFKPWLPTLAHTHFAHWRYLFDVTQSTSAFRLPFPAESEFPGINTLQHQPKTVPADLPTDGLHIGNSDTCGQKRPILFKTNDRRRHTYIIGQTGTGKSTLFYNMIMQDIKAGFGVGVIDPHGNLVEELLSSMPEKRLDDVVLFDPGDRAFPMGINPLDAKNDFEKDFNINYLIEIFDALYDLKTTGGPIFEMYMRGALMLLLDQPENFSPSVLDVPRLFQSSSFRDLLLDRCKSPYVRAFWKEEALIASGDVSLRNVAPYITSKLGRFIYNDLCRCILGQRTSTIDFTELMDTGKIFLINLNKGLLGKTNCHFLGMLLIGKLFTTALARKPGKNQAGLKDFFLYIDEFQNLATPTFSSILSESRKYRLSLILTNQYIAQINPKITSGILGNVGTLISFRIGSSDAEIISNEFGKMVNSNDLMGLPNWEAFLRMLVDGNINAPFNMKTIFPERKFNPALKTTIRSQSRKRYARPRAEVEKEILKYWGEK